MKLIFLILFGINISSGNEAGICENCNPDIANPAPELTRLIESYEDIACNLINNGMPLSVKTAADESGYNLIKIAENSFVAEINPQFYAKMDKDKESLGSYVGRTQRDQVKYTQKMTACLKMYNLYLKGPNGEKLEIKINNSKEVRESPIFLIDAGSPSNSAEYAEDIKCPVILHEVLHLLGLVDEYAEEPGGRSVDPLTGEEGVSTFQCRSPGPEDSIMNVYELAILNVLPTRDYDVVICECLDSMSDKNCNKKIKEAKSANGNKKNCPAGFTQLKGKTEKLDLKTAKLFLDSSFDGDNPFESKSDNDESIRSFTLPIDESKYVELPPVRDSLLLPAHFRKITNPLCDPINRNYNECAQYAYSKLGKNKTCSELAKKCQSNFNWLK